MTEAKAIDLLKRAEAAGLEDPRLEIDMGFDQTFRLTLVGRRDGKRWYLSRAIPLDDLARASFPLVDCYLGILGAEVADFLAGADGSRG